MPVTTVLGVPKSLLAFSVPALCGYLEYLATAAYQYGPVKSGKLSPVSENRRKHCSVGLHTPRQLPAGELWL